MSVSDVISRLGGAEGETDLTPSQAGELLAEAGLRVDPAVQRPGIELRLSLEQDPLFGPVVVFSYGRMAMDIWDDVAYRVVPLTPGDARLMVQEPRAAARLLGGYGPSRAPDTAAIEKALLVLSRLAEEHPQISEVELDPVFAYPDGLVARSARVVLRAPLQSNGQAVGMAPPAAGGTHRLERIFNPRSVAVVGSKKVDNHSWLRTVLPFQGPKYHVNIDRSEWPSAEELGFPNYPSLLDVPGDVDYVIVSVPAQVVPRILRDCVAKKVAGVHLYTAGFSETGTEEGIRLEKQVVQIAREGGLKVVGPNCMGVFNPRIGVGVNLGGYHGPPGGLGILSHSGSQSSAFGQGSSFHGIRLSKLVSMGNGVILDSPDYIDYFGQDPDTRVIGMYLEGVRNGRAFFETVRRVTKVKPVLVWKVGETEDASRAVASHSTSSSARPAVWDAMVRQCGAVKVENMDELFETAKLLLNMPPATGYRLGVLALSGGHATECANVFSKAGFNIPRLADESYKRILEHFNIVGSTYANPIEGRTLSDPVNMNNVLDVLNDDPNVDIIVQEVQVSNRNNRISIYRGHNPDIFCEFRKRAKKPYVVALSTAYPYAPPEVTAAVYKQLMDAGVPASTGIAPCASALKRAVDYYYNRAE
ncbi:MAG: acetate--CoA ligase family protein [Chloroflexi bacterium]|nr:acetate--CoA ligase family protein [Chloroflexota bacterium]